MKKEEVKKVVRKSYAKIAQQQSSCCAPVDSCCGNEDLVRGISKKIGYSEEDIKTVPEGANLGLGCGNPVALASLKEGETVLDLGSGAGFDCFLAADKVGKDGRVIGIDMTPEMVEKARENGEKGKYKNVEFRLGEIEHLPAADSSVDIIISNCVINLAPDKNNVFMEAFRVLKPGGRLMISDIVLLKELPDSIKSSIEAYVGCVSGAVMKDKYIGAIKEAGFKEVRIIDETSFPYESLENDPATKTIIENLNVSPEEAREAINSVISINIYGIKPLQH
jgi:ubiquinone/menaquinone biosynthesis C-methylase UbiE